MSTDYELPFAVKAIAAVLGKGAVDHPEGSKSHWLNVSVREHLRRASAHLYNEIVGSNTGEDDLAHCCARIAGAVLNHLGPMGGRERYR